MKMLGFGVFYLILTILFRVGNQCTGRESKRPEGRLVTNNLYDFVHGRIQKKQLSDNCMIKLIEETIHQKGGSTFLFIKDNERHQTLLDNLQANFVNSFYTDPAKLVYWNHVSFHHLFVFLNEFKVEDVIRQMRPVQGTRFFIVVNHYQEAEEKFKKLWEYRIIEAVASFVINETVYCYSYAPYGKGHCEGVGTLYLAARCHPSSGLFSIKNPLFPRKADDFHGCPINISFPEIVPSSYYTNSHKLTGWEIEIMNEIIQHMNGVPNYNIWQIKKGIYRKSTGYMDLVKYSDIGGGLAVSLKNLIKTDFCMYGQSLCGIWVVPKSTNAPHSVAFLYKIFPNTVWLLILLCFLLTAISYRTFFKVTWANVLFKLLPYLFGTTTRTKKVSKMLGALWLWFCLIMNFIYQSGYQSAIMVPDIPRQLTTTKEVLLSDLNILGIFDLIVDAIPYYKRRYNVSSRKLRLINRKLAHEEWVLRMAIRKDSAFFGFKEIVHYHTDRTELGRKLNIPEACDINYMLSFILKKNSHLTNNFVKFSNRLNENGFVAFFFRKHLSREARATISKNKALVSGACKSNDLPPSINMDKMSMVFICQAVGLALATVFFVTEITSKKLIKKWKETFRDKRICFK